MDIHEYQAKEILADYGIQTLPGGLAYSPEQAVYQAKEMGGEVWVVKAYSGTAEIELTINEDGTVEDFSTS